MSKLSRYELGDLIRDLTRETGRGIPLSQLESLVARLELRKDLIDAHTRFHPHGYGRNPVCRTPEFDLLLLCWRPGQKSTIHDHSTSKSVVRVHRGELTSRTFARLSPASGQVRMAESVVLEKGRSAAVPVGAIHQLSNESASDLITIHVYAPPLDEVGVYSLEASAPGRVATSTLGLTAHPLLDRPTS